MADPKDTLTPPTDPKSARSAAVKPPVLEGTARPASESKDGPKDAKPGATRPADSAKTTDTTKPAGSPPPPTPPKAVPPPVAKRESGTSAAWIAGLLGGVLGLGGAYGLASLGYWPAPAIEAPATDPRVAQISTALPELQTVTETIQSELSVLTSRVGVLENAPAPELAIADTGAAPAASEPAPAIDIEALTAEITALQTRLDELAAENASADNVDTDYTSGITALQSDISRFEDEANRLRYELEAIGIRVETLETTQQASASADQAQARLPLILSSFEAAFANGGDYADALRAATEALPGLSVPDLVAANAASGLKRPEVIAQQFNAVLPDMLAARPLEGSEGWQGATADWFRGIIALRPTGDVEGSDPEAVIARLEAALARRDFGAAAEEFSQLPESMQAAAGPVASDIAAQAQASSFLTALRQAALENGGAF